MTTYTEIDIDADDAAEIKALAALYAPPDYHKHEDERSHKPLMEREELRDVISLSLWAGQMLLQNGASSQRIEDTVHRLGTHLGCDWMDVVVLPDSIILTTINNHEFRTKARRAPVRGVNMELLARVTDISYRVQEGQLDRFGLRAALREVDRLKPNYNRWLVVVAVGAACAAFSRLFGADAVIMLVTFIAAMCAMFVRQEMAKRHFNSFLINITVAFVASLLSSPAVLLNLAESPRIALAASTLLLVPGVQLINAAEDLLRGYMLVGLARGLLGLLLSLSIALGIALAISAVRLNLQISVGALQGSGLGSLIAEDMLWSALAAGGFAILFNAPKRTLLWCAGLGALGHGLRTALLANQVGLVAATLAAATLIGFIARRLAEHNKMPAMIFGLVGSIPMVPGVLAFQTMIAILEVTSSTPANLQPDTMNRLVYYTIQTGLILAALGAGIAAPNILFRRPKPVV